MEGEMTEENESIERDDLPLKEDIERRPVEFVPFR